MDLDNIRMIQLCRDPGFMDEGINAVARSLWCQESHSDMAAGILVVGLEDLLHATGGNLFDDFISICFLRDRRKGGVDLIF